MITIQLTERQREIIKAFLASEPAFVYVRDNLEPELQMVEVEQLYSMLDAAEEKE